ncbi:MAG: helix-turn-helix domain-containing protein [Burkholderiales bacterium]|nr:helix-turn-helix domain-containing protein [Burkholderiales bacterium]
MNPILFTCRGDFMGAILIYKRITVNSKLYFFITGCIMSTTFAERLREVREAAGLSQEAMGAVGGVTKLTQFNYENDKRSPDANYLASLAKIGVDVLYLVTGQRMTATLDDEERVLLNYYRAAPEPIKKAALGVLLSVQNNTQTATQSGNIQNNHTSGNAQHNYAAPRGRASFKKG